jgi:hypothetical protein
VPDDGKPPFFLMETSLNLVVDHNALIDDILASLCPARSSPPSRRQTWFPATLPSARDVAPVREPFLPLQCVFAALVVAARNFVAATAIGHAVAGIVRKAWPSEAHSIADRRL